MDFRTMAPKSFLFILAAILVMHQGASAALVGGWKSIANTNDPEIKEIAKFAVEEHNRVLSGSRYKPLGFLNVVRGETQVVAGINYRLFIKGKAKKDRGSSDHVYEAIVWVKSWEKFRKLTSFRLFA